MEGAILSSAGNGRLRSHLKNAASALCARTLPKQRLAEPVFISTRHHHTYPRATPPRRAAVCYRMEPLNCEAIQPTAVEQPQPTECEIVDNHRPNGTFKLKGNLAKEVASAWDCRVGPPNKAAPAQCVQSLFNDIELYPTKTQVFEMLVCAKQCARRKSFTLTFGEFCVFAAELRRCSRQARQPPTQKPESPQWNVDKELRDKDTNKLVNGSEATPPPCEVFLGGSCNPTTWRTDIAIPMLKEMGITYFNPQVDDWSTELMEVEHRAKAAARALLFVLDSETRAVAASVEAALLAAEPRDLLLVLKPYNRQQIIGQEKISEHEYVELSRARATLQEVVERRGLPAFTDIPNALRCARMVLRGARTQPQHILGYTIRRLKRTYDVAGGRNGHLPRAKALDALRSVTNCSKEAADGSLPLIDTVDFEAFCAAVAGLASDPESHERADDDSGVDVGASRDGSERGSDSRENGLHVCNARLKAYGRKLGLFIPKNGGNRLEAESGGTAASDSSADSVFTPGTERRLERLPAMLGAPMHDVYLGGIYPSNSARPEEVLRREGLTYIVPRPNDYTRMFSAPARRSAPAHPESPRHDKKPRPSPLHSPDVQLRDKSAAVDPVERLSASDFYSVSEDSTPKPFKGMYDEDLLLGSRLLVFSMCAESPCFATMVLAAHYIGLRPNNTVLLVQSMDANITHHNYSEVAIKDYNRGRHYLVDLAQRAGIPVFSNVDSTMAYVVNRLKTL